MPTTSGWKLLAVGVAVIAAGRAFGILEFYVIGAAACTAVVTALAVRLVHPSRLAVRRRVSATMVAVAEPLEVRLEVANRARSRSPAMRITEQATGEGRAGFGVAPVPGGAAVARSYRLQPHRRGVLEIGPTTVTDIDGLGLARRRRILANRSRVIVHPPIERLAPPRLPVGGDVSVPVEFRRRSLGLASEEFDVLRPYTTGDDLRHIHWRSTARLDEFVVRRFQPSRPGRLTVVIDTRPPSDSAAAQDRTTSVAGSIVGAVLRSGDEARIVTTDGRGTPLLSNRYDFGVALEFLAMLEDGRPTIDIEATDGASVVVAVTASPDAIGDVGSRHGLAQRLGASLVVTCGPPAPELAAQRTHTVHNAANSGAAAELAAQRTHTVHNAANSVAEAGMEDGWIHLTGPGQLPGLWRLATLARRRAATRP